MNALLDELYLNWLYEQVGSANTRSRRSYWELFRHLYSKEFVWFIPNDDNRVADGIDLRYFFLEEGGITGVDAAWLNLGCSFLEMLVALSRKLSFEADGEPRLWFWHLIEEMGILFSDKEYNQHRNEVDEAVDRVTFRAYDYDGKGGLFPLRRPEEDQREVELWFQLNAYLLELN